MTQVSNWTRENISWFAGLFEGEGSISINRGRTLRAVLQITMTDEDVVRKAHNIIGVGNVTGPHGPYRPNEKPTWSWRVAKFEESQAVMAAIYQFLGIRRRAKIKEVLDIKHDEKPRSYGDDIRCGSKHLRSEHAYKNGRGHWVCRVCSKNKEVHRARRSLKSQLLIDIPKSELKNFCSAGHPKTEEHGKIEKSGYWRCLTCRKISMEKRNGKTN